MGRPGAKEQSETSVGGEFAPNWYLTLQWVS
jgi:hypothetical protein